MRKWYCLVAAGAFAAVLGTTGPAGASTLTWAGTLVIELGSAPPMIMTGIAVSTINGSAGLGHLNTLRVAGGISGGSTIAFTDPDVPTLISLTATAKLGTGTLSGISGGPPLGGGNQLPVTGLVRLCLATPACPATLPIPLTVGGTAGVGIGGLFTVNTFSPGAGVKVSVSAAPWTIGTGSVTGIPTVNGGTSALTAKGFVHGPGSGTSSTATTSGVIRMVTPVSVQTSLPPPSDRLAMMGVLTLHFLPEPGMLLLLGSGVAGLLLLGRQRMRP